MDGAISNDAIASLSIVAEATKLSKEEDNTCGLLGVSSHSGVCTFCTYNYDRELQEIDEGLYLGSLGAAHNRNAMKACNVTHVLTVASSRSPTYPNDFTYKIVEVLDRDNVRISLKFEECFAFIDEASEASGGVLVHCFAGKSRSATIVIAYLMYKRGLRLSEALKLVKAKRPLASPISGFLLQLKEYETSLRVDHTVVMKIFLLVFDIIVNWAPPIDTSAIKRGLNVSSNRLIVASVTDISLQIVDMETECSYPNDNECGFLDPHNCKMDAMPSKKQVTDIWRLRPHLRSLCGGAQSP